MIDKKKACPVGGTTEQAAETAAFGEAVISHSNFSTGEQGRQVPPLTIADILPRGRESALKLRDLKELFSESERTIRLMIQRERRRVPILSDNASGYWVSDDEAEVRRFTNSMRHRARQIWATASNVEKAAGLSKCNPQLEGQLTIDSGGGESA